MPTEFTDWLKTLMTRINLNSCSLAREMGVKRQASHQWKHGVCRPRAVFQEKLNRIAVFHGLLPWVDEPPTPSPSPRAMTKVLGIKTFELVEKSGVSGETLRKIDLRLCVPEVRTVRRLEAVWQEMGREDPIPRVGDGTGSLEWNRRSVESKANQEREDG